MDDLTLARPLPANKVRVGETVAVSATPDTNLMTIVAVQSGAAQLAYLHQPEKIVGWMRADWLYAPTEAQRRINAEYRAAIAAHLDPANFTLN